MSSYKTKTDMTVSVPKADENGDTVMKVYRIYKDINRALWIRMDEKYVSLQDVISMYSEVQLHA